MYSSIRTFGSPHIHHLIMKQHSFHPRLSFFWTCPFLRCTVVFVSSYYVKKQIKLSIHVVSVQPLQNLSSCILWLTHSADWELHPCIQEMSIFWTHSLGAQLCLAPITILKNWIGRSQHQTEHRCRFREGVLPLQKYLSLHSLIRTFNRLWRYLLCIVLFEQFQFLCLVPVSVLAG